MESPLQKNIAAARSRSLIGSFAVDPCTALLGEAPFLQNLFLAAGNQFDLIVREGPIPDGRVIDQTVESALG